MAEGLSDNVAMLMRVADRLAPLRDRLVFLGGAITELFITAPGRRSSRHTKDVDVIIFDSVSFWHDGTQRTLSPLSSYRTLRARTVCRSCLIGSALSTTPAMTEAAHCHEFPRTGPGPLSAAHPPRDHGFPYRHQVTSHRSSGRPANRRLASATAGITQIVASRHLPPGQTPPPRSRRS